MKLGVFDSGIGGEAIARSLQDAFPAAEVITVNDKTHLPYGSRTEAEIRLLTDQAIQPLLQAACDVIVIACNTATTIALEGLRQKYPHQKFIGIEPMVKPATALTKSGVIAVCATPRTLTSERYGALKNAYAKNTTVLEPDCSDWAYMIENHAVNRQKIDTQIRDLLDQHADVIVLGCTHYHWIKDLIEQSVAGKAAVIEPSSAIAARVKGLLDL
jgi:glutamate racemase